MKLKATIISLASILVVGLTAILLYCFWPAIKGTVNNSKYYTQEELQNSYDKGYDDGCKSETELIGQVEYYKGLVDEYYIQVNTLNNEITMLTKTKKDYETQIANIESQKATLQTQVDNLTTIKTNNETTITSLNSQITSLQTQIAELNTQINDMTVVYQNYTSNINSLNSKINELQTSINYYESYIANLESGEQVVATFEYNGSVYNIQTVNKGSTLSITTPTDTDRLKFNYWTVNGEQVDLSTYTISANTKFVANITKLYTVTFMYEEETKSTQTIRNGNYATNVIVDSTDYKVFNGWKVNGVITDISSYKITADTQFIADITYKYDLKFMVDDKEHDSQIVTTNCYPTLPTNPTKDGYEFDGWSNGENIVNPETIAITGETSYWASFTQLHTVTFTYEGKTISTQTIRNGNYATNVAVDNTTYKVFNGWKVNDEIVDLYSYKITADTQFVANITYYEYQFQAITFNGLSEIRGSYVWTDGTNIYYSYSTNHYVLDKSTNTWTTKTWNGLSSFGGYRVWTDGTNIYWAGSDTWYVLNKSTSTWTKTTWEGAAFNSILVSAKYNTDNSIWTDGENIYFSCYGTQYVLDKSTNTWNKKTWTGLTEFYGSGVWTDGENIYYSWGSSTHYKLNKDTSTWEKMTWKGFTSFHGPSVWTDGNNIYYSKGTTHYVLNKETNTWTQKTWDNLTEIEGMYIWTDGTNTYYSKDGNNYILRLVEKQ